MDNPSQIADTTNVFVNDGVGGGTSTFNLNGRSEDVNGLTVGGNGAVTGASNSGLLEVRGPLSMTGGTISGTADPMLQLDGNVTATSADASTPATISGKVALKGARTLTVSDGPATNDLAITNVVSDEFCSPGASLTKAGTGQLALTPPSSNLYTGGTTIARRDAFHRSRQRPGDPGRRDGDRGRRHGSSRPARCLASASTTTSTRRPPLVVRPDGLVDLQRFVQSVASLDMQGGTVQGPGSLRTNTVSATSSSAGPARVSARLAVARVHDERHRAQRDVRRQP